MKNIDILMFLKSFYICLYILKMDIKKYVQFQKI
jgi:hypothetical protein